MTLSTARRRRAFTLAEATAALVVLGLAAVIAAQLATAALTERARSDGRHEAAEAAANVLEAARATPWEALTPEWAAGRKLPPTFARAADWTLAVRVEPEKGRPRLKRVTVEMRWAGRDGTSPRPVTLVALFAARTAGGGS